MADSEEELEEVAEEVTGHFAIGHLAAPPLTRLPHVCVCVCVCVCVISAS